MSKKIIISLVVIGIIAVVAIITFNNANQTSETGIVENNIQNNNLAEVTQIEPENKEQTVKEFTMDSFVEFVDGKPKPQFSVKEITVNKGDLVRIKITTINGRHDFKIDELNVFADTPTGETTTVEFTANQAGEFVYYCTQPGHRANGHWGTLRVLE